MPTDSVDTQFFSQLFDFLAFELPDIAFRDVPLYNSQRIGGNLTVVDVASVEVLTNR